MCSSVSCTSSHVSNKMFSSTCLNPPASKRSRQNWWQGWHRTVDWKSLTPIVNLPSRTLSVLNLFFEANEVADGKCVPILLSNIRAKTYGLLWSLTAPKAPKESSLIEGVVGTLKGSFWARPDCDCWTLPISLQEPSSRREHRWLCCRTPQTHSPLSVWSYNGLFGGGSVKPFCLWVAKQEYRRRWR